MVGAVLGSGSPSSSVTPRAKSFSPGPLVVSARTVSAGKQKNVKADIGGAKSIGQS